MQTDALRRPLAVDIMGLSMPLDGLRTMGLRPGESASIAALVDERADAMMGEPPSMNDLLHAVTALISAVNCALSGEGQNARQFLNAACQSLEPEPECSAVKSPAGPPSRNSCRGGLAPWQIRCVSTHIEGHLSESIQCEDLSNLVNLSLSHFMRAFRDSFGCPPHAYLMKRRMERAQGLMLTTDTALGAIALECGLADQSHLSRLFQRFVGESPAAWRRARAPAAGGHR